MPGSEDRSRSPSDKSEPNNVSPYGLKYNDLAVVLELSEHGVSLSEPHDVAYYLYALSEQTAAAIAAETTKRKFRRGDPSESRWNWPMVRRVPPSSDSLEEVHHGGDELLRTGGS